jgi:hypothetical protein
LILFLPFCLKAPKSGRKPSELTLVQAMDATNKASFGGATIEAGHENVE